MKKGFVTYTLIGLAAGLFSMSAVAGKPGSTDGGGTFNGNGAPSGPHYNLNLLGMENPKGKTEDQTVNSNGKRIFVYLTGKTTILLTEGDFDVIDYDGTDGTAAFQLPNPDPDCDGVTDYSVYARALGGGGSATMKTCATDGADTYCSTASYIAVLDRSAGGKPTFTNVSRELLYVTGDFGDGLKRYPLFGDALFDYYWEYDNYQLRLAQLRFYEIETDTSTYDEVPTDCTFPTDV